MKIGRVLHNLDELIRLHIHKLGHLEQLKKAYYSKCLFNLQKREETKMTNDRVQEIGAKLWAMANELRGNMDASEFKNYILAFMFYRYLSEHQENIWLRTML